MLKGDCRATLAALAPGSVQSVITSPPYYALRDYGSPPLVWGGDPEHAHEWGELLPARKPGQVAQTKWANVSAVADGQRAAAGSECACGAWLGGLGLEPTPALFVEHLVECFRHVRRVLREDGVLWLNLGDSYSSGGRTSTAEPRGIVGQRGWLSGQGRRPPVIDGAKPKDLLMIPFRAALALQADGWYLRSVIPWVKRNPMPESVLDRPSNAIEYVFLLAKSESYYWDADSVRAATVSLDPRHPSYRPNSAAISENGRKEYSAKHEMSARQYSEAGRNRRNSDWFFESWQGLMLDEEGEALALVVNPAPYSGYSETVRRVPVSLDAIDGDTQRIASPTCPVHASEDQQGSSDPSGERADASVVVRRTTGMYSHPVQERPADSGSTPPPDAEDCSAQNSGSLRQPRAPTASGHSSQGRRTDPVPATSPVDSASVQMTGRTVDKSAAHEMADWADRTDVNSISADSSPSEQVIDPSVQSERDSVDRCTCSFFRYITERTSHYATFPPKLIEPMIRASTSERGQCPACGKPWERVTEREPDNGGYPSGPGGSRRHLNDTDRGSLSEVARWATRTTGWRAGCEHTAEPVPQRVLDPFGGAGTVGLVADRLGRDATLCELSPDYSAMGSTRIVSDAPLFAQLELLSEP